MTYRALLIGNSTFEADAGLNPLNAPTKDVARLHRALVDPATGLFADEHVRLVIERTSDDLLDELDVFFTSAHRDDLLLLYYSGHGLLDERNQLFLCGRNTRSDRLLRTAVSNVRINEFIEQSVARCTVIILDCCSSGMFKGGADLGVPLAGPGRYVVSSTRGSALANDAAIATGTSLFTEHLVTGLLGEAEDRDGDGFLDLREIYDYVRTKLTATSKQIPHSRFDGDASVVLARRADAPRPKGKPGPARPARAGDPTFVLSENVITLHDVDPHERLSPEVVEIYRLGDQDVDCTAETGNLWLRPEVQGDRVVVALNPAPGHNRGKIVVRDRTSGTAQVLRVHVFVNGPAPAAAPPPGPDDRATTIAPPSPASTRVSARAAVPAPARTARIPAPAGNPAVVSPSRRRWILVTAVAAVLAVSTAGLAYGLTRSPADPVSPPAAGPTATDTPVAPSSGASAQTASPIASVSPPAVDKQTAPKVAVPSLGDSKDSADAALRRAGLYPRFEYRSGTPPKDHVTGSKPARGTKVPSGSTIVVYVSSGDRSAVPNVVGMTQAQAAAVLNADGFSVSTEEVSGDGTAGTVISQSPHPGSSAGPGDPVTIRVLTGPSTPPPGNGNGG